MKAKRLLVILFTVAALLTGCTKEDVPSGGGSGSGGGNQPQPTQTTINVYVHDLSVPSGMAIECLIIEYSNQNEPLETHRFDVASQQVIHKNYTATSHSVKVKAAFNIRSTTSSQTAHLWIQKVFYLNQGGSTQVEITGSSPTGSTEP